MRARVMISLLTVTMILLGVLYLAHRADFLGLVQIFVYTGAVMMLFIFVVMIVGVDASDSLIDTLRGHRWISIALGLGLVALLVVPLAIPLLLFGSNPNEPGALGLAVATALLLAAVAPFAGGAALRAGRG